MSVRCPDAALAVRPPGPALPGRSSPAPGRHFLVSGFQTEVTFPQGVASALTQMSPITGKVTGTVRLVGAIPDSRAVAESFVATIPASVPAAGFNFWVPARAVGLGIFTAASKAIAVEEESGFALTLEVGQRGRGICAKRTVCAQRSRGDQPTVSSAREGFSIQTASTKDFNCEFRRNRSSIPLAWSPLVK